jgi:hypothetical protein
MAERAGKPANPERLSPEELTRLQPGLARLMPEIANRLWRAVYSARAGHWRLARWQLNEMSKLFNLCTITRPKYSADIAEFLHEAVDATNEFHRRWEKGFIVWKLPESAPPDLDLTPR